MIYTEWVRWRGCERKTAYPSQMVARNAATLWSWIGLPHLREYRCDYCHDWHLTKMEINK